MTYNQIITELCEQHNITVKRILPPNVGRANFENRLIYIPKKINNRYQSFMTALHEIGHVVNGKQRYIFYGEYLAERYAIDTAQRYNIDPTLYFESAKCYVTDKLCLAINKGLKYNHIPAEVEWYVDIPLEYYYQVQQCG